MNRLPNIDKKTYLRLMRELRRITRSLGFELILYRRPVTFSEYASPNFGSVKGIAMTQEKKLIVTAYGHAARRTILHAAAHEVRHALHHANNLFPEYYDVSHQQMWDYLLGETHCPPENYTFCPERTALMAEIDCNRWASLFLRKHNVQPPGRKKNGGYKLETTYTEMVKSEIKRLKPSLFKKLSELSVSKADKTSAGDNGIKETAEIGP